MTDKETKKVKTYEEMTVEERYHRINALWLQVEDVIKGKGSGDVDSFFITIHQLGAEVDRFIRQYFNGTTPSDVIGNIDILNKVNRIQLLIKVR